MAWQIGKTANGRVYPHDYELWFSESLYSYLYIKGNCFTNIHFHPSQCKLKKASFRGLYAMRGTFFVGQELTIKVELKPNRLLFLSRQCA